jgi:hypothetical protein
MKVWVLHVYGSGCGDPFVKLYATWDKAFAAWKAYRQNDLDNFDDAEEVLNNEDIWREHVNVDAQSSNAYYSYDSDDGWVYVEVFGRDVEGFEGRNKL